jgi:ABC-type branched-subunit amino acid transport system ATPase component
VEGSDEVVTTLLKVAGAIRRYGRLLAVDRVDLALSEGARHAVIGPNGAGKTTLLHLIAGTVKPNAGQVWIFGREVTRLTPARRARLGIARTFQTPAVCQSLTVLDNVVLGAWVHAGGGRSNWWPARYQRLTGRSMAMLDSLGLAELADRPAGSLAHGQRRLLEIGAALAARPRLLLLDEPAAGLTDADLPRLLDCLRQLPAHVAVLLVEHHLDVVSTVADTVTVLHRGRVVTTGSPREVATDPAVTSLYLGTEEG